MRGMGMPATVLGVLALLFALSLVTFFANFILPNAAKEAVGTSTGDQINWVVLTFAMIGVTIGIFTLSFSNTIGAYMARAQMGNIFIRFIISLVFIGIGFALFGPVGDYADSAELRVGVVCQVAVGDDGVCGTAAAAGENVYLGKTLVLTSGTDGTGTSGATTADDIAAVTNISTMLAISRLLLDFVQVGYGINLLMAAFIAIGGQGGISMAKGGLRRLRGRR